MLTEMSETHIGPPGPRKNGDSVIILGLILFLIGVLANIGLLQTIGAVLLIVGLVLMLVGRSGRAIGGRSHWY